MRSSRKRWAFGGEKTRYYLNQRPRPRSGGSPRPVEPTAYVVSPATHAKLLVAVDGRRQGKPQLALRGHTNSKVSVRATCFPAVTDVSASRWGLTCDQMSPNDHPARRCAALGKQKVARRQGPSTAAPQVGRPARAFSALADRPPQFVQQRLLVGPQTADNAIPQDTAQ
eukprot:CAMPEP_0198370348 /NCGR_PEP_ID=MMETSP1450-20131203/156669_1 /TAXON_ID=753684 ORGANISM="Madagascaria erythrocladiodes, Strain CCMP3234" /NCGR_SAMPLE_ID=MMETSP1450 /ASSEMBLY_ACC=CAM_ASM_001115 /LENGTH=168 /DNA_ID=CAMNT_0044077887 /DNA_START=2010 /DNA_END=2512 /DNA_ORIENTATION=+